jgi:FkbM family methyltransferase
MSAGGTETARVAPALLPREWTVARIRGGVRKRVARKVLARTLRVDAIPYELARVGAAEDARMLPLKLLPPGSICYCVGVGVEVTLDVALAERGCRVYSFDPTPNSIEFMAGIESDIDFAPVGVWSENATLHFHAPAQTASNNWSIMDPHGTADYFAAECKTIRTLMHERGHDALDLLKLDIEGAWEPVLDSMLREGVVPRILAVEFDSPTSVRKVRRMVRQLRAAGLRLVHFDGEDYVFVRRDGR